MPKNNLKTIAMANDHAGYNYKIKIKEMLMANGFVVRDFGQHDAGPVKNIVEIIEKAALDINRGKACRGILICGSGVGMAITANKIPGCYAALCPDLYTAKKSREHNDANILALGSRVIALEMAKEIVNLWLDTDFGGHRYSQVKRQVLDIDNKYRKQTG